ncbi:gluconokinase [Nocardiopsis tropica]|uniref:Gluconokinase n=1 Tax=Nocardiopsis tropica TaxID=109330 RepID=A0ABU7KKL6_9ACTN|nr:gluconokinase [Nocardiopsis umidischolae]MEE2049834.1 gluconokinase [Nocardiopsis umidischolae]
MNDALALVVMGVSGSGKTSVGHRLAEELGGVFLDADDLHSARSVRKMSAGVPLNDDDRWPWLDRVAAKFRGDAGAGAPMVIACSALRRVYRDRIRQGVGAHVFFLHLEGTEEVIAARMVERAGHFMPASLLMTQLRTLERLEPEEAGSAVDVHADLEAVVEAALKTLPKPGER